MVGGTVPNSSPEVAVPAVVIGAPTSATSSAFPLKFSDNKTSAR